MNQVNITKETTQMQLGYFAICVIAKDEHLYIEEWLQYHIWKGASKIYIYDNGSQPPLIDVILPFIQTGHVDYMYHTHSHEADDFEIRRLAKEPGMDISPSLDYQKWAYDSCMAQYAHRHQFVGIFDVDEFLVTPSNLSMKMEDFLRDYENYGGLTVERRFIGPSGHIKTPNTTVLESYTKCTRDPYTYRDQRFPKTIVNVKYFDGHCFAHYCSSRRPLVNTKGKINTEQSVKNGTYKRTWEGLVVYHYFTKSYEDLFFKYMRKVNEPITQRLVQSFKYQQQSYFKELKNVTNVDCNLGITLKQLCCSDLQQKKN